MSEEKKSEYKIVDDIFAPDEEMKISFNGKNPFLVATIIMPLYKSILKVSATNLFEEDIRWDVLGDMKAFYGVWRGIYPHDKWTKAIFKVIAQGAVDKEKNGWVDIRIKGRLITEFKHGSDILSSMRKASWWLYSYTFYWKLRRAYLDYDIDMGRKIKEEIQAGYDILRE